MLNYEKFIEVLDYIKQNSKFDKFDLIIDSYDNKLTRFANSMIHQNVAEKNLSVKLRGIKKNKVGIASINSIDKSKLDILIKNVETIIDLKEVEEEVEILDKYEKLPIYNKAWNNNTVNISPIDMANFVDKILKRAKKNNLDAFGALEINLSEIFYANSYNLTQYHPYTLASVNVTIMGDNYSYAGLATDYNIDISKINFDEIGEKACNICINAKNPKDVEPKKYDVILSHQAVANLFFFLTYLGFSAKTYQEGRSFLCNKLGSKICGENITLYDDGFDGNGLPMPFDFEGMKRQKLVLIENGIAKNLVYDLKTAKKEGKTSTGHAMPFDSSYGPLPTNLFVKPGDKSVDEMIKSTDKGLLITSFHYVNVVNPNETIITGMTRNGTFMIENGKISYPIKNLRFTESICNALSNVEMIGNDPKFIGEWLGGIVTPTMKIKNFNFTSKTEF